MLAVSFLLEKMRRWPPPTAWLCAFYAIPFALAAWLAVGHPAGAQELETDAFPPELQKDLDHCQALQEGGEDLWADCAAKLVEKARTVFGRNDPRVDGVAQDLGLPDYLTDASADLQRTYLSLTPEKFEDDFLAAQDIYSRLLGMVEAEFGRANFRYARIVGEYLGLFEFLDDQPSTVALNRQYIGILQQAIAVIDEGDSEAGDERTALRIALGNALLADDQPEKAVTPLRDALNYYLEAEALDLDEIEQLHHQLADAHWSLGNLSAAETHLQEALLLEKQEPDLAVNIEGTLSGLAWLMASMQRPEPAETYMAQSLAATRQDADPRALTARLEDSAQLHLALERFDTCLSDIDEALAAWTTEWQAELTEMQAEATNEPDTRRAELLTTRAMCLHRQGRAKDALAAIGQAMATFHEDQARHPEQMIDDGDAARAYLPILAKARPDLEVGGTDADGMTLAADAFIALQSLRRSSASVAIEDMAARFLDGTDNLGKLLRESRMHAAHWDEAQQELLDLVGDTSAEASATRNSLNQELAATDRQLAAVDTAIEHDFPTYFDLIDGRPIALAATQALLQPDEALLLMATGDEPTIMLLTDKDVRLYASPVSGERLAETATRLRDALVPTSGMSIDDLAARPFPAAAAQSLYDWLIRPGESALGAAHVLYIVPDSALDGFPFGILLTAPHDFAGFPDYATAPWLTRRMATVLLPSAPAFKALRDLAGTSESGRPFFGIGDPAFSGKAGDLRGIEAASLFRDGVADLDALRNLPQLPDARIELQAIAAQLGAGPDDLLLGKAATEHQLKAGPIDAHVLAFATHGIMPQNGVAEPGLALTPPDKATSDDDGLLTAGEIATQLNIKTDIVVLSACNTAAPDFDSTASGLSTLSTAFIYAGAKSLLGTLWSTETKSARRMTTGMFAALSAHPEIGFARALQQSALTLMDDAHAPYYAHPMFWAAFTLIGDGRAR